MTRFVKSSKQADTKRDDGIPWGARIKLERQRLGLTQAALAKKAGISRATQVSYENNKRDPSGNYLQALGQAGADVGYIFFGQRSTPENFYSSGATDVLPRIARRAGVDVEALLGILWLFAESEAIHWGDASQVTPLPGLEQRLDRFIEALFEQGALLGKIFFEVSETLHASGATLGPEKRADLILLLYDTFKAQRRVDRRILNVAVKAALA